MFLIFINQSQKLSCSHSNLACKPTAHAKHRLVIGEYQESSANLYWYYFPLAVNFVKGKFSTSSYKNNIYATSPSMFIAFKLFTFYPCSMVSTLKPMISINVIFAFNPGCRSCLLPRVRSYHRFPLVPQPSKWLIATPPKFVHGSLQLSNNWPRKRQLCHGHAW